MRNRVIALVSNNIATDQRLIKVGTTLTNNGFDFSLIGINHRGKPDLKHIPFQTKRSRILFQQNLPFYAELQTKLFYNLVRKNKGNAIILANDLDTLWPATIISKLYRVPLVVDFHEIYTEMPYLKNGSYQKRFWKRLERRLVPKLKHTYTVSKSYADWYNQEYGINPVVIQNMPFYKPSDLRLNDNTKDKHILIYQGVINSSRGIDKMIQAMNYLDNAELWIIGGGPSLPEYKKLAVDTGVKDKINFFGKVSPKELRELTPKADLGLSLEVDNGLSYRYALPNKLFDYIHAGIPILGSPDLPEMVHLIQKYQIGEVVHNHEPEHIAEMIKSILEKGKMYYNMNLSQAAKNLNWQSQEEKLLAIFRQFD